MPQFSLLLETETETLTSTSFTSRRNLLPSSQVTTKLPTCLVDLKLRNLPLLLLLLLLPPASTSTNNVELSKSTKELKPLSSRNEKPKLAG
jgi:hypothetical protein